MSLREVIKNSSKEDKQAVYATLTRSKHLNAVAQNSDSTIYAYETPIMSIIYFRDGKWANYVSFEVIGNAPLATDHSTSILAREEVLKLLKEEEYTIDNLPESWFVEVSDQIDEDLLNKKTLSAEKTPIHYKYYGKKQGNYICSDNANNYIGLINVTHLFLKKKEENMKFNEIKEEKFINTEIVELDGRKFRLVPEQANFKNSDIVMKDGKEYEFIGYYEADVVLRECVKGELSQHENVGIFKLEEVKTKVWHYAIYKDEYGLCHSDFHSSKEELKRYHPNALECRTYEEQL